MPQTMRILLIEDDPDHARLIVRQLSCIPGFETTVVHRLAEGAERAAQGGSDVVLLDIFLPDCESDETLRRLLEQAPDAPIVVLTALDDMEHAVRAVQQGAQDYLVKSQLTPEVLERAIRYAHERKLQQIKLEHYMAELQRAHRDFQEFAHIVSHDLKTPMWVVAFCLDLVQKRYLDQFDAETREFIDSSVEAMRQMRRLIDDLVAFARIGREQRAIEPIDCNQALDQALSCIQPAIVATCANVTRGALPVVSGDATQLLQLFQNLIENAIKYRGDDPPLVHVDAARQPNGQWLLSVRDNGRGIAPQDHERVFLIFERIASGKQTEGSGLGLAICKRIVQRHGGRIWVESKPGSGSTFYFTLPAAS
jgi:two-component system, sensor histidine kinase and response regulator